MGGRPARRRARERTVRFRVKEGAKPGKAGANLEAMALTAAGELGAARAKLERELERSWERGQTEGVAAALANLAVVHLEAGSPAEAVRRAEEALKTLGPTGSAPLRAAALYTKGQALVDAGDPLAAVKALRASRELAARVGDVNAQSRAQALEGRALGLADRGEAAISALIQATIRASADGPVGREWIHWNAWFEELKARMGVQAYYEAFDRAEFALGAPLSWRVRGLAGPGRVADAGALKGAPAGRDEE